MLTVGLPVTFQTAVTFPGADQSQGWKCDTSKGKQTFPPEASVSDYLQHHGCDAAHIQAFLFLDLGWIHFSPTLLPGSSSPTSWLRFIRSVRSSGVRSSRRPDKTWILMPELPAVRRLLSEPSDGGAAGRWGGGGVFKQDEEVGKLMSLQINTRGCWNLSSVTKSARGCNRVFRTSASSETWRRWSCRGPDRRSEADKIFFFCSSSRRPGSITINAVFSLSVKAIG